MKLILFFAGMINIAAGIYLATLKIRLDRIEAQRDQAFGGISPSELIDLISEVKAYRDYEHRMTQNPSYPVRLKKDDRLHFKLDVHELGYFNAHEDGKYLLRLERIAPL
jgi:hypothetical protein